MSDTQFCPKCPTDMPEYRESGRWVEVDGHEHTLPPLRPNVYLLDSTPGARLWGADLSIWRENCWKGAREFKTQAEAMAYAERVLVPLAAETTKQRVTDVR